MLMSSLPIEENYIRSEVFTAIFLRSVHQLLVTANIPSSPTLVALMMEALRSPDTSVLARATQHIIPEYGILQFFCL
jgi:hypothetical protein